MVEGELLLGMYPNSLEDFQWLRHKFHLFDRDLRYLKIVNAGVASAVHHVLREANRCSKAVTLLDVDRELAFDSVEGGEHLRVESNNEDVTGPRDYYTVSLE